jgi:protein-S-isoprenylcysteine O-methyltransferase Ste14
MSRLGIFPSAGRSQQVAGQRFDLVSCVSRPSSRPSQSASPRAFNEHVTQTKQDRRAKLARVDDRLIYAVHIAFWGSFGITRMLANRGAPPPSAEPPSTKESAAQTAPFSRAMLAFHMTAFGVMYFGLNNSVIGHKVPDLFPGQRIAGTAVIALGAFMMCWSLVYFRSWRFRAQLDASHQLATEGPFAWVRHPIYLGLNLLAIGTALWIPTQLSAIAVLLMIVGSDLRGRAEEKLLTARFGDEYRVYMKRARRFVPGIY